MKKHLKIFLAALFMMVCFTSNAQNEVEMADGMRAEGKIYVVVAIILIILGGLVAYLFLLDRKVKKLQDLLDEKKSPTK